jgi:hypothetical protein
MNLHDPKPTAAQIYDDLRPRLLAWPAPVAQPQPEQSPFMNAVQALATCVIGGAIVVILFFAWVSA